MCFVCFTAIVLMRSLNQIEFIAAYDQHDIVIVIYVNKKDIRTFKCLVCFYTKWVWSQLFKLQKISIIRIPSLIDVMFMTIKEKNPHPQVPCLFLGTGWCHDYSDLPHRGVSTLIYLEVKIGQKSPNYCNIRYIIETFAHHHVLIQYSTCIW